MRILQRYILQEIWLPFLVGFVTLNFIFMGGYLVRAANLIVGHGIPFLDTIYLLILALPEMISYTAPTSLLTAVLIVFGGLSQNNEIRAMKASGLNPFTIMTPALLAGLALSFVMFLFNDQITTNASFTLRKVSKQMLIRHPAALIEPGRFVKLNDQIVFLTKSLEKNQMKDIVAYETEGQDKPIRTIMADRGEIVTIPDRSELEIHLYDGSISDSEDASVQSIQFKTYQFPTIGQEDVRLMRKKMRDETLAELLIHSRRLDLKQEQKLEIWSAFHQRIAFSLGSFIFVFIGIPIAVLVRRGEIVLSFGVAMAAASLYYVLFAGAKTISLRGILPPVISFWIPNLILLLAGSRLLKKSFVS